jgi:ABC-type long-subunit fatty acid transport system fused permease/ATPase subunit
MADNPRSEREMPGWAKGLINALYVLCAVVGVVVGVYGLYILVADVLVIEDINIAGLAVGLLVTVAGFGLFAYVRNKLPGTRYENDRYRPRTWAPALLGLVASSAIAYFVFTSLRGA